MAFHIFLRIPPAKSLIQRELSTMGSSVQKTYTQDIQRKALTLIASGMPLSLVSKEMGISKSTLFDWKEKYKNTEEYEQTRTKIAEEQQKQAEDFAKSLQKNLELILSLGSGILVDKLKDAKAKKEGADVSIKELNQSISVAYDKHALLTGQATQNVSVSFEDMPE